MGPSAVVAALAMALFAGAASAQTVDTAAMGGLSGFVIDSTTGEPLAGVTVVAAPADVEAVPSAPAELVLTAVTDETGNYRIHSLPAGRYSFSYYYSDAVATREYYPIVGGHEAVVVVELAPVWTTIGCTLPWYPEPIIEPAITTAWTTQCGGEILERDRLAFTWMETVGDMAHIAPGAVVGDAGASFSGAPTQDNDITIFGAPADGDLLLDFVHELTVSETLLPTLWSVTGGAIEVTPKSGSNQRRGSVFARAGRGRVETGVELGGPIERDKAWYYVGVAPRRGDGETTAQVVGRVDYAVTPEHQGLIWAAHLPTSDSLAASWTSKLDDSKKQLTVRVGAMRDQVASAHTTSMSADYTHRFRAHGYHELIAGLQGRDRIGDSRVAAAALHDHWDVEPNVSIEAGVRYDRLTLRNESSSVDPWACTKLGVCDVPPSDVPVIDGLAPSVGLLWDWTKEGRSRLFAHAGRNHRVSKYAAFDGNLIIPDLDLEHVDEYTAGVEYEILERTVAGLALIHRRLGATLETVAIDGGRTRALANPGDVDGAAFQALAAELDALSPADPQRARLTRRLATYELIDSLDAPERNYNALVISTRHEGGDLDLRASYAYARTTGSERYWQDRPHNLKVAAVYRWLDDGKSWITTGVRLHAMSGAPGEDDQPRGSFETITDLHLGYHRELGCLIDQLTFYIDAFDVGGATESVTAGARATF